MSTVKESSCYEAPKEGTRPFNNHVSLLPCSAPALGGSTLLRSFQRGENLLRPLATPLRRDPTRKKEGGRKEGFSAHLPLSDSPSPSLGTIYKGRPRGREDGGWSKRKHNKVGWI